MRRALPTIVCCLLARAGLAAEPPAAVALGEHAELLKLPKDNTPTTSLGRAFVRLSPTGRRLLYLRRHRGAGTIPHLVEVGRPKSDSPVPWEGQGIGVYYARLGMSGVVWRADGQRAMFLQPKRNDDGTWVPDYQCTMSAWAMCWDAANPQCGRIQRMSLGRDLGCTSASYSADGKMLWTALGNPKYHKLCGVTEWDHARRRGATIYKRDKGAIFHLAPSPDGKHLAWVEQTPAKKSGVKLEVVVFRRKGHKTLLRYELTGHLPRWLDVQPPIWTRDSKGVCFGDVIVRDRVFRRQVYVWDLAGKGPRPIVQFAWCVGAAAQGLVLNRGPGCTPMRQHISSFIPPGRVMPTVDEIILADPAGARAPQTLLSGAFAQQVVGDRLVYVQASGEDMLVMSVRMGSRKGAGKASEE